MFRFIKKMFIALLNDQPIQVTSKFLDVNTNKPFYYPFVINAINFSRSTNN